MKLRELFAANGYPRVYFDKVLERFLVSLDPGLNNNLSEDLEPSTDKKYIFGVPYVGKVSRDYQKKITQLIKEHLGVDIFSYNTSC